MRLLLLSGTSIPRPSFSRDNFPHLKSLTVFALVPGRVLHQNRQFLCLPLPSRRDPARPCVWAHFVVLSVFVCRPFCFCKIMHCRRVAIALSGKAVLLSALPVCSEFLSDASDWRRRKAGLLTLLLIGEVCTCSHRTAGWLAGWLLMVLDGFSLAPACGLESVRHQRRFRVL